MKPSHDFKACLYNFLLLLLFALGSAALLSSPPATPLSPVWKKRCLCRPPAGRTRGRRRKAIDGTASPTQGSAWVRGVSRARCELKRADAAPCRAGEGADFHARGGFEARDVQLCLHLPRTALPAQLLAIAPALVPAGPGADTRGRGCRGAPGSFRARTLALAHPAGVPREPRCPRRGWDVPDPGGGRGWVLCPRRRRRGLCFLQRRPFPRGAGAAPGHCKGCTPASPKARGPGMPSSRSCFASRLCGQVQVQVPQAPAPGLPSPPFPRGNLSAKLGQGNQTATPGAMSREECFDPALSPRRRGQIAMTNAGDPSRLLGQRCHRLI